MTAVRQASADDAPEIAELFIAARDAMGFLPELHTDDETRAFIASVVADCETWVMQVDGAIAGFAALGDDELEHLYVAPAHQARGLGTLLVDKAKTRRPGGFGLWTFEQNTGARRFYERHGFVEIRRTEGDNEERLPDIRYEWRPI